MDHSGSLNAKFLDDPWVLSYWIHRANRKTGNYETVYGSFGLVDRLAFLWPVAVLNVAMARNANVTGFACNDAALQRNNYSSVLLKGD